MARQILPLAGQIVGGMIGGPVGAAIGGAIGSVIGNAIDPQIIKGPKLGDGQVQTSAEGVFRPIVIGTGAVMGNIIHRGPEVVRTHRQRQGKGSGPKAEETRRYRTFAIRVAEGPIAGILRIWMDEKLVYDIRNGSDIPAESVEFADRFRLYFGDEDQLPDPDIEAYLGIGNVNAYRGTAYVVFPNFDLTDYGDRIPQFRFEVSNGAGDEVDFQFDGGSAYPANISIPTPFAGALVVVDMYAGAAPDKMTITSGVAGEVDTGYVGAASFQSQLNNALASMGLPPEPINQGTYSIPDPAVTGGIGYGSVVHVNKLAGVTSLPVQMWAPLPTGATAWTVKATIHTGGFNPILLSQVVAWLHERVGASANSFDASALQDLVDGIVFAGDYTAADCIRTLMTVYMFDASEHDAGRGYGVNYVKRGGPVVATITADSLVDEPEESVREDALERPKKLHLHFQSPTVGYAPAKATSMRNSPDVMVTGEVSASVPVVFGDVDEAWRRAGVMHQVMWSEVAGTQELVFSDAWLELVPTDCIGLVLRDQQRRLRITKVEYANGTIKCEMIADRQSSYTSSLTGIPLPEPTPPPPSIVGPTVFAFLDIPALTDSGDRLLYYVAVSGQTPAWYGAVIQRSLDGGANYEDVLVVRQNTIMGTLLDPVSSASEHYTDTTNVVRVQLFTDDEIQSLTQQQFLSEGGAFALEKSGGGWEVLQYRDADDEGNGVFALTTLLRGRLNSGSGEHLAGARFVMLDDVYAINAETAMIGRDLTHRAVSLGTSPELGPVSTDSYVAKSQTEWPIAHVLGEIDDGGLPVQIVPRHRFGTEDRPVRSANWDGYRLTATDGSNAATIITQADSHTFSVSGWSTPITVTASQLNRFTGAGPSVSEEFE